MNLKQLIYVTILCSYLTTVALGARIAHGDTAWKPVPGHIATQWAALVSPANALPEYPRPQMVRRNWQSLNGLWDIGLTDKSNVIPPAAFNTKILVPYCYESSLSGVAKPADPDHRLWYRRSFTVPKAWHGQHVILHFGAVNWDTVVLVNGKTVGTHRGGYTAFSFDITGNLISGLNELSVGAWNPVVTDVPNAQVVGKQRLHPGGIFYTSASGIWQTVWLEPVPAAHIENIKITPDIDAGVLRATVTIAGSVSGVVTLTADDGGSKIGSVSGPVGTDLTLNVPHAHLWSPSDPHLYGLNVTFSRHGKRLDSVDSYFAMRKISLGTDDSGHKKIFLNNKFVFEVGALDQGYWPDGIYTAPTDVALRYDIEMAKNFGFNLLRKHAKVEPDRWYYWTDKLGMLVWQDMPQEFGDSKIPPSEENNQQFLTEWGAEINELYNHPSIIVWTTFNEGWGQHDTAAIVAFTKQLDRSRLVNNASGWNDMNVGDLKDTHAYPGPWCDIPSGDRASVNGEFGGIGLAVPGHMWDSHSWGYQGVQTGSGPMTAKYQQLLKNGWGLMTSRADSALVYTQLTDVEEESNGLMTYDRAIVKPDIKIVAAANRGVFPALPPAVEPASAAKK